MDVVVENLTKSFGYQKAVDSVSFEVKKERFWDFWDRTVPVKPPP